MATQEELLNQATEILYADQEQENTAMRVGSLLVAIIQKMGADAEAFTNALSNYVSNSTFTHDMTVLENALREALSNMSDTLYGKADVFNIGGAKHLKHQQAALVSLQSVEQIPDSEGLNNKMWWSSDNGHLKYRHSGDVYDLGEPGFTLYYCGSNIYKWTGSGFTQVGGGEVVNDLVTGGEDVALSAEMGKELSGMIEDSTVSIWIGTTDTANDTLFIRTNSNEPTIILGSLTPSTLTCKAGSSATATVSIRGRHLSSNVSVAVEGTNASLFSVSPVSFTIDADGKVTGTVTVTYSPTAGTAASTQHSAALKVTSGTVTQTLALSGTVAAGPSLTLTPSTLNLTTTSGSSASGTIHLEGSALDGDVTLSITGNYVTFADGTTSKTISKADATSGVNIEVKFTATDDTTATLTASSTGATSKTASIVGTVAELPSGFVRVDAITPAETGAYINTGKKYPKTTNSKFGIKHEIHAFTPNVVSSTAFVGGLANSESSATGRNYITYYNNQIQYTPYDNSQKLYPVVDSGDGVLRSGYDGYTNKIIRFVIGCYRNDTSGQQTKFIQDLQSEYSNESAGGVFSGENQDLLLFRNDNNFALSGINLARYKMWTLGSDGTTWSLELDMIPCRHFENDVWVYGMYDKISGDFFKSTDASKLFEEFVLTPTE